MPAEKEYLNYQNIYLNNKIPNKHSIMACNPILNVFNNNKKKEPEQWADNEKQIQ
jgi:hypothetical protein